MTKIGYNNYRKKLNSEKISNLIIQTEDLQTEYDNWTNKVNQIKKSCEIKKTNKNKNKTTRILMKSRREIKKQIEKTKDKDTIQILKQRKKLITQHILKQEQKLKMMKITKTVENLTKKDSNMNRHVFWELKRKIDPKKSTEHGCSINND